MDSVAEKFQAIYGGKRIPAEMLERIMSLKNALHVRDDDAIWAIFITLEMYLRSIDAFNANIKTTFADALVAYKERGCVINIIERDEDKKFSLANVTLIFGVVLMLCTVSFFAGAMLSGYSPPWITGTRASSAAAFIMQLPAGWIFFVMAAIPSAYLFLWSVRKFRSEKGSMIDRLMSYGVVGLLAGMIVVAGALIVWLMIL